MNNDPLSTSRISVEEARKILGEVAITMSDNEIEIQLENLKYLAESWLDNFEKSISTIRLN